MYYNNILLQGKVGFVKPMRITLNSRPRYYLVKHIDFYPQYYKNQVVGIKSISDKASAVDISEVYLFCLLERFYNQTRKIYLPI